MSPVSKATYPHQETEDQNKLLSKLYKENDVPAFEKLEVDNMLQNHSLAKSISWTLHSACS